MKLFVLKQQAKKPMALDLLTYDVKIIFKITFSL